MWCGCSSVSVSSCLFRIRVVSSATLALCFASLTFLAVNCCVLHTRARRQRTRNLSLSLFTCFCSFVPSFFWPSLRFSVGSAAAPSAPTTWQETSSAGTEGPPKPAQCSQDKWCVVVDKCSVSFLEDALVDYADSLAASEFRVVQNGQAENVCSCGHSFAIKDDF